MVLSPPYTGWSEACGGCGTVADRSLERNGMVSRTATPSIPPRVDDELTTLAHSLAEPVNGLGTWVIEHSKDITAA
ncbi:winged helix-turn-helix transcriptional regulator [Methylobacterium phyllosphaerae]